MRLSCPRCIASALHTSRFLFDAFDCYISLFYVGFVQQDWIRPSLLFAFEFPPPDYINVNAYVFLEIPMPRNFQAFWFSRRFRRFAYICVFFAGVLRDFAVVSVL